MSSKIKVALCLSGEPRNSMFSFPYIYESLIDLGPEYKVDVYIHSWKNFRALPLYKPKSYLIDWVNEKKVFDDIIEIIGSKNHPNTDELIKSLNEHSYNSNPVKNYFLMYLSMQKCFNLIDTPYDIYIRGRFDFYMNSPLHIIPLIKDIQNQKYNLILPSLNLKNSFQDILKVLFSDQFAICDLKGANYYFNIFNKIPILIEKTGSVNTHDWLKTYLEDSDLNIKDFYLPIDLVRSSRIITTYNHPYYEH